ncbi:MAG: hypothetical protein KJ630_18495 [Proteobacteria bacterium]|nr:hypothetical protein [Pseudomonadota bacterium]
MKRIPPAKLVVVGCLACILLTLLFIRSNVYKITQPNQQESSAGLSSKQSEKDTITVHFHDRRPFYINYKGDVLGLVAAPIGMAFEDAGIPFRWQETPAKRQLDIIRRNEDKSCAAGWFKTPEREAFAQYTLPVYQDQPFVGVFRADNKFVADTEMLDRVLAERSLQLLAKEGYSYGNYIDGRIQAISPRQVHTTADNQSILRMILNYRADYSFMTEEEARDLLLFAGMKSSDFKLVHFSDMPPGNKRYIICSKQVEPQLLVQLNVAIRHLVKIENGE